MENANPSRLTPQEVNQRISRGEEITFVDSRREEGWEKSTEKLPQALRVPPENPNEFFGQLPHHRTLVTYCT